MKYLALLWLCIGIAQAQMVDTFEFHSDEARIRAVNLARSLRCPQCQNQNLVESNASQAYQLRLEVYHLVNQGKSDADIRQMMTARFGDFVHYQPPMNAKTVALWSVPLLSLLGLLAALVWRVRKQKGGRGCPI